MPVANTNFVKREIITVPRGSTKNLQFVFIDEPDLRDADIKLIVIESFSNPRILFQKGVNHSLTQELNRGIFFITIEPQDTINLEAFTYFYDLVITFPDGRKFNPVRGEFIITESGIDEL
jgi:hypothetical protein